MKELAEDNDDGQHEEERQDKRHGGEQLFLAQRAEKALKHGLMYFQRRGNVKRLKPDLQYNKFLFLTYRDDILIGNKCSMLTSRCNVW